MYTVHANPRFGTQENLQIRHSAKVLHSGANAEQINTVTDLRCHYPTLYTADMTNFGVT